MNKEEYKELLERKEWQDKRKIILKRDNHKCTKCNCNKSLHLHHTYYLEGKMPWEVPDDCLITLCKTCHEKEHKGKDIKTFARKYPPKNKLLKKVKPSIIKLKLKKLRFYRFIALKSKTLNKIYGKPNDRRVISALAKDVDGKIKGFDSKILAEQWLRQ